MSEFEKEDSLRSILLEAAKSGDTLRFYGQGMMIIAEGKVAFLGRDIVGVSHGDTGDADEFINLDCIIKVQILGDYRHY
jgi:hypothetical protein